LIRYKNYIIAASAASIEFLYNNGNATGSPMNSADQLAIGSNSIAPAGFDCMATIDGEIYWIGSDQNLYTMSGSTPKKLSSLGTGLSNASYFGTSDAQTLGAFTYNKMSFLNVSTYTSSSAFTNYWYCIDTDMFFEPNFGAVKSFVYQSINGNPQFVLQDTSGKIYFMNNDLTISTTFQDNGAAYTMSIQLATDMGTWMRKIPSELRILADVQSSGSLSVYYSDDDGATWSAARTISLTSLVNMKLNRLGTWKGIRIWKFEHSSNTPFRAKQIEIDYELAA
jgi:hypothetical protein